MQSAKNCNTCNSMFQKVALLEISRSPLLTGIVSLQSTVCKAPRGKLLNKSLKGTLKLTENFEEVISNGIRF